jgi:hypothetical protein
MVRPFGEDKERVCERGCATPRGEAHGLGLGLSRLASFLDLSFLSLNQKYPMHANTDTFSDTSHPLIRQTMREAPPQIRRLSLTRAPHPLSNAHALLAPP